MSGGSQSSSRPWGRGADSNFFSTAQPQQTIMSIDLSTWPRAARETVAKLREELRNAARIKSRDSVFESERLQQWNTRENLKRRFANGVQIEIELK